jgi:hypothetical protein
VKVVGGHAPAFRRFRDDSAARLQIPNYSDDCSTTALGAVTVRIRSGASSRKARLSDGCDGRWRGRRTVKARGWRMHLNNSAAAAEVTLPGQGTTGRSFRCRVTWRDKPLAVGSFRISRRHPSDRTHWQGSDGYWNYCIHGGLADLEQRQAPVLRRRIRHRHQGALYLRPALQALTAALLRGPWRRRALPMMMSP